MAYMVLNIVIFSLIMVLFINMAIQFIRLMRTIQAQTYNPNTKHTFQCKNCQFNYDLNGTQMKKLRWKTKVQVHTPFRQSTGIRFRCPNCKRKATQVIQYDYNITKGLGLVRLQMNEEQKAALIRFGVFGFLPIVAGMILIQMIQTVVSGIIGLFS